jgi:predicted GIY-YIG superfamily endonuclease
MYYTYILWSQKSKDFYYGYSEDLEKRFEEHNKGLSQSTAPYRPWKLVFYAAFETQKLAKDFEKYLKTGSGKAFAYKRFLNTEALKKDKLQGI